MINRFLFLHILILILNVAHAGSGSGAHGGNPSKLEFASIGRYLSHVLKQNTSDVNFSMISRIDFDAAVENTLIESLEFPNTPAGEEERRTHFKSRSGNSHDIECALNYWEEKKIELDQLCWDKITLSQKLHFAFHEYLGILKIEWDNARISSHLPLLISCFENFNIEKSQNAIEKIISQLQNKDPRTKTAIIKNQYSALFKNNKTWYCDEYSVISPGLVTKNIPSYIFDGPEFTYHDPYALIQRTFEIVDMNSQTILQLKFKIIQQDLVEFIYFLDNDKMLVEMSTIKKEDTQNSSVFNPNYGVVTYKTCNAFKGTLTDKISELQLVTMDLFNTNYKPRVDQLLLTANSDAFEQCTGFKLNINELYSYSRYSDEYLFKKNETLQKNSFFGLLEKVFSFLDNGAETFISKKCSRFYNDFTRVGDQEVASEKILYARFEEGTRNFKIWTESIQDQTELALAKKAYGFVREKIRSHLDNAKHLILKVFEDQRCGRLKEEYKYDCLFKTQFKLFDKHLPEINREIMTRLITEDFPETKRLIQSQ